MAQNPMVEDLGSAAMGELTGWAELEDVSIP